MEKKCTKCKETKPSSEFKVRKGTNNLQSWCVDCVAERNKEKIMDDSFMFMLIGDDPVWMRAYFG